MKFCFAFFMTIPFAVFGQVADGFEDGDFTHNPLWTGDTMQFQVTADHRLQLHAQGNDTAFLATQSAWPADTEWRFWVRLGFNTSSNNNVRIYLASNNGNLAQNPDGFYLQVGGSADSIDLMKKSGTQLVHLYRFSKYSTSHSNNIVRFRIVRATEGVWHAFIDTTGGMNFISDGSFVDTDIINPGYLGVWCRFTSSNATRFYFDDFYSGPIIFDTLPPLIESVELTGSRELLLRFSEPPERATAIYPGNYKLLAGGVVPDSISQDGKVPEEVRLHFRDPFAEGLLDTLSISGIMDQAGNIMNDTLIPVCYYRAKAYDIVINEIMADPEPVTGLPEGEFIELYNRKPFPINLNGWSLQYGSFNRIFPAVTINPNGHLIVAKDSGYMALGQCLLLLTSSTSLSNEGTTLVLRDAARHVIHTVSYSPDWFCGSFKEEGGWSLEMTDPANPCGGPENWAGSNDPAGGTPGKPNSMTGNEPDVTDPYLVRAAILDSLTVQVWFSEQMDSLRMMENVFWKLEPNSILPQGVALCGPDFRSVKLSFGEPFAKEEIYILSFGGSLCDCAGNFADSGITVRFSLPDSIVEKDIVINEILANPASGGSRFLELFNRSEKVLDLSELLISDSESSGNILPGAKPLTEEAYLIFPGDYIVFCGDRTDIKTRYRPPWPERIEQMNGFPTLDIDSGVVILARKDNFGFVDRVVYSSRMHYPLLVLEDGVSLERINADLPSCDFSNWHSAASTVGFATPGYQNSQMLQGDGSGSFLEISPKVFSPDNDGTDDLLTITINSDRPGYSADIDLYDIKGRRIRRLSGNSLLSSEGIFTWDGTTDNNTIAAIGIYILYVLLVHPDGTVKKFKRGVTVAGKF